MTIQKLPGSAITPGTITVTQLESSVATTVQTGGGPKLTNIQVTNNAYTVLDDTAVSVAGGYIKITGTGFVTGCSVIIGTVVATSVSFISSTEVRAQVPAQSAGTYTVYLINPDGGVGIRVNGLNYSSTPTWTTTSPLPSGVKDSAISIQLVAASNSAITFSLQAGSTLPTGLTLSSSGLLSGTVTGIATETTYNFTIVATDAENQDTPQAFSITIIVGDLYFRLTTLLLPGDTGTNVLSDASTNNFNLTAYGDARASNFTPYSTGWSLLTRDRSFITIPASSDFDLINTDFTLEFWLNWNALNTMASAGSHLGGNMMSTATNGWAVTWNVSGSVFNTLNFVTYSSGTPTTNSFTVSFLPGTWYHAAFVRSGSAANNLKLFVNGQQTGAAQTAVTYSVAGSTLVIGSGAYTQNGTYSGNADYSVSNFRLTKSVVYAANFTPSTTRLTSLSATTLLLFTDGQLINRGTNTGAITSSGHTSTRVSLNSYNPFNITNTGVNGSIYLDGTGDYVGLADSAVLDAPGDFTLECWYYPITNPADCGIVSLNNGGASATVGPAIRCSAGTFNWSTSDITLNSGTSVLYQWHHLSLVRNGTGANNVKAYINGQQVAQGSGNSTQLPPQGMVIGRYYTGVDNYYAQGYVADVRYVVGTAVYTANFTPTTSRLTTVANTQVLTCQFDQPHNNHTFLDSSSNQFVITRYGNASQGTFSPFSQNGWSAAFNSTSNYISVAYNAAFNWSLGARTYEAFILPTSNAANNGIFCLGNLSSSQTWELYMNTSGQIVFRYWNGSGQLVTTSGTVALNTWSHIAFVYDGSSAITIYINGVLSASTTRAGTPITDTNTLTIGRNAVGDGGNITFTGYISNVRMTTAVVYTGNFTPATTTLTTTSQGVSAANVALLVLTTNRFTDQSTASPKTVSLTGSPLIQALSPFAPSGPYTPSIHGGSMYLDGTGDYLEMTYNAAFKFAASQDFCVEFWAYATSSLTANYILSQVTTNNWGFIFGVGSVTSGRMGVYYGNGATNSVQYLDDTAAFPLYQWIHVAWCRTSGTMSLFVDGTRRSTVANTNAINLTTDRGIRIGAHQDGAASTFWPGYIASLRSIVGNSPYDATLTTLTLPTTPATSTANTSILLNFVDGAIIDRTGRNVLETVADAKTSSVVTKFTGGSMYFDGTGDWTIIPTSPNFGYGTGDFTIELWLYWTGSGTQTIVSNLTADASTNPHLYIGTNVLKYFTASTDRITGPTLSANQWYHIAISRSSGSTRLFVNGTQSGSTYADSNNYGTTAPFALGTYWNNGTPSSASTLSGYVSDLRITRGYARYTANFTVPASRFIAQ